MLCKMLPISANRQGTKVAIENKAMVEAVLRRWPIPDGALTVTVQPLRAIIKGDDVGSRWQIQAAKALWRFSRSPPPPPLLHLRRLEAGVGRQTHTEVPVEAHRRHVLDDRWPGVL